MDTKFKKGHTPWSKTQKGVHLSPKSEFKKGMIPWNKGKPMSEESKRKMIESCKTCVKKTTSFWKGKQLSLETRRKMSDVRKREKHWGWKGGVSKNARRIYFTFEYKEWRKKIFERDNFTCVNCKKTGCYLEADHIKPFAYFIELRFELSNGRTLCKECHRKTETYGGRVKKLYKHLRIN